MAYNGKTNWTNNEIVEAVDMNRIEQGTTDNDTGLINHKNNTSNPHQTTKAQVGLGNVPNVATNDQTPTYSQASAIANLTSGEKLSVAFGKIMKAIADFITHKNSTDNPHGVTAAQAGADPAGTAASAISTHNAAANAHSALFAAKLDKAGGVMTGVLTLSGAPTANLHAATKQYVDDEIDAIPTPDVSGQIATHNAAADAHSDIRTAVAGKAAASHTHAESDITGLAADLDGKAPLSHDQAASTVTAGTLGGKVQANATAMATLGDAQVRDIYAGTTDLTTGVSALPSGSIYIYYTV